MRLAHRSSIARADGSTRRAGGGPPQLQPLGDRGRVVAHLGGDLSDAPALTLQPWRFSSSTRCTYSSWVNMAGVPPVLACMAHTRLEGLPPPVVDPSEGRYWVKSEREFC